VRGNVGRSGQAVPWLVELCAEFQGGDSGPARLQCTTGLLRLYALMARDEWDQAEAEAAYDSFASAYLTLRALAEAAGSPYLFHLTPKFHLMAHIFAVGGHSASFGNPAGFWNYQDESFIGLVAKTTHRRGGPGNPRPLAEDVVARYRAAASLV
jgi:hypothetical protein